MALSGRSRNSVLFSFLFCLAPIAALAGGGSVVFDNDDLFRYDINSAGELSDGSWNDFELSDACDGCWDLLIDGNSYNSGGSFTLDPSGREATFAVDNISGLEVSRRVYVPQEANFIRHLNILTNPTGDDITVEVSYDTNLGSDSSTTINGTSSGDFLVTTEDFWLVTDGDPNDPVVTHVWDGYGGADRIDSLDVTAPGNDDVDLFWENVTVAAGETVIYMTLGAMNVSVTNAVLSANQLLRAQSDLVTFDLDEATIAQIQNWLLTDDDEDGMLDGFELFFGLNPDDLADAASDTDMDGLTALQEFNLFTDPTDSDSDNDGLPDGAEVDDYGTDPVNADTDGDGISDGGELFSGLDPLEPGDNVISTLVSDGVNSVLTPAAFEDSDGNLHIVYAADIPVPARGGGNRQVFYTLITGDGEVLIAPTQLSDLMVDDQNQRAQVAANDDGIVYVTWQCCRSSAQLYIKTLDVSADDQDGSAADLEVIGPTAPRQISLDEGNHSAIAVDSAGNAHILAQQRGGGQILYYQIGPDGLDIVTEVEVANFDTSHATPDLGLDSEDNVHFVYSSNEDPEGNNLSAYQLFYGMLSGVDGSTLIAPTLMTPDDGTRAKHTNITVDDGDMVHVVWGNGVVVEEVRGGGGGDEPGEVFYTKLDPSLDDQSGDAASAEAITVVPTTMLTDSDGMQSWYVEAHRVNDAIEITWIDTNGEGSAPVYHMRLMLDDGSTTTPQLISTTARAQTYNNYAPAAGNKVILKEDVDGVVSVVVQNYVARAVATATGTGQVEIDTAGGIAVSLEALALTDLPADAQSMAPDEIEFPDGLFRIVINGVAIGGTVDMSLTVPTAYDSATDILYKWNATDGWVSFPYTLGATPSVILFTLTDGGAGDADGIANGQIVDPVGPAVSTAPPPMPPAIVTTSVSGSGGGSGATTPWLLLLAGGLLFVRNRRTQKGAQ